MNPFTITFEDGDIGKVFQDGDRWHVECGTKRSMIMAGRKTRDEAIKALIEFREQRLATLHTIRIADKERAILDLQKRVDQFCDPELVNLQDRLDDMKHDAHMRSIGLDSYYLSRRAEEDAKAISAMQDKINATKQSKQVAA